MCCQMICQVVGLAANMKELFVLRCAAKIHWLNSRAGVTPAQATAAETFAMRCIASTSFSCCFVRNPQFYCGYVSVRICWKVHLFRMRLTNHRIGITSYAILSKKNSLSRNVIWLTSHFSQIYIRIFRSSFIKLS